MVLSKVCSTTLASINAFLIHVSQNYEHGDTKYGENIIQRTSNVILAEEEVGSALVEFREAKLVRSLGEVAFVPDVL